MYSSIIVLLPLLAIFFIFYASRSRYREGLSRLEREERKRKEAKEARVVMTLDEMLQEFSERVSDGDWNEAINIGLLLVRSLESANPTTGFFVLSNMAMSCVKLNKSLYPGGPKGVDLNILRAHLYGAYAGQYLDENGPRIEDSAQARARLQANKVLGFATMMVTSAFEIQEERGEAVRAMGGLQDHEKVRFKELITELTG